MLTNIPQLAPPPTLTPVTHMAFIWGEEDGQKGAFQGEQYFANVLQIKAYCLGYRRTGGETPTIKFYLGGQKS